MFIFFSNIFFILVRALLVPGQMQMPWLLAVRIVTIAFLYTVAILFIVMYILSIGFGFFSELFNDFLFTISSIEAQLLSSTIGWGLEENFHLLLSLVPVHPGEDKPSPKLPKEKRAAFSLSEKLKQILVGLLLGDLYGQKQEKGSNIRFIFKQGVIHKDYLMHLFVLFKDYCLSAPKIFDLLADKRTGKVYSYVLFRTLSLPCFNELYELFYVEGKKVVPVNIFDLLSPVGLAFWICDDGSFDKIQGSVVLNTQGFTLAEVELLANTLNDKWNLECTINKAGNGFRIRIPKRSLPILQSLLKDIIPSMMRYKIGL